MMGIFSKKINNRGAVAGMLAGLGSTLVYIFIFKGWFFFKSTAMLPDNVDNWFFGINPQAFGFIGACLNFIIAYIVSGMTDPVPQRIQDLIEDIRVPAGGGAPVDH
jgi:cation/acetate symporter